MTPILCATLFLFSDSTPRPGETILFVGDSITQAGEYVAFIEAYILACRPSDNFRVINVGKSSETVSGTSEPDHQPPRPCLHDRFTRDVAAFKPNIVVACYGMNDGNYFPLDHERFAKYQAGINRLVDRVFKETPARALVLLTPPSFDANRAPRPPEDGKSFGYKHPSPHYDGVLRKYSEWLLTLKSDRVTVVDVHRAFKLYYHERKVRSSLSPDGVHPNPLGHAIIAQSLLGEWKIRPEWNDLFLDVRRPTGELTIKEQGMKLSWRWTTPPVSPPVAKQLGFGSSPNELSRGVIDPDLYQQQLRIVGLPDGEFCFWDLQAWISSQQLARGVPAGGMLADSRQLELANSWDKLPRPQRLIDAVRMRRAFISGAWLNAQKDAPVTALDASTSAVAKAEQEAQKYSKNVEDARRPRSFDILISEK